MILNIEFRNLLDKSSALMSICDAMSEEYKIRYNKDFIPFHNPIEIEQWLEYARTQWDNNKIIVNISVMEVKDCPLFHESEYNHSG